MKPTYNEFMSKFGIVTDNEFSREWYQEWLVEQGY